VEGYVIKVISNLDLVARLRAGRGLGAPGSAGSYQTERRFWDFVVDGTSLHEAIAHRYDLASVLWVDPPMPDERAKAVRRLLLLDPGDLPGGRVSLYTCPECGDLGCGAITADIEVHNDFVKWANFGYQSNYDDNLGTEPFESIGPFQFEWKSYEAKLLPLVSI
jgi:hypothetical protein